MGEEYPNNVLASILRKDFILRKHNRRPDRWHWADLELMQRGAWDWYDRILKGI